MMNFTSSTNFTTIGSSSSNSIVSTEEGWDDLDHHDPVLLVDVYEVETTDDDDGGEGFAYTNRQALIVAILPKPFALLSIMGSYVILREIFQEGRHNGGRPSSSSRRHTGTSLLRRIGAHPIHRMLVGMALGDVFFSTAYVFSTWAAPPGSYYGMVGDIGTTATCNLQALAVQLGMLISIFSSTCLSVYYLLMIRYEWKDRDLLKIEPYLHGAIWLASLICSVYPIPLGLYNSFGEICWFSSLPPDCVDEGSDDTTTTIDDADDYVPPVCERGGSRAMMHQQIYSVLPIACILVSMAIMLSLYCKVRSRENKGGRFIFASSMNRSSDNVGISIEEDAAVDYNINNSSRRGRGRGGISSSARSSNNTSTPLVPILRKKLSNRSLNDNSVPSQPQQHQRTDQQKEEEPKKMTVAYDSFAGDDNDNYNDGNENNIISSGKVVKMKEEGENYWPKLTLQDNSTTNAKRGEQQEEQQRLEGTADATRSNSNTTPKKRVSILLDTRDDDKIDQQEGHQQNGNSSTPADYSNNQNPNELLRQPQPQPQQNQTTTTAPSRPASTRSLSGSQQQQRLQHQQQPPNNNNNNNNMSRTPSMLRLRSSSNTTATNNNVVIDRRKSKAVFHQAVFYSLAFFMTYFPPFLANILAALEMGNVTFDYFAYQILYCSAGTFNFLVFARNRSGNNMKTPEGKFWRTIWFFLWEDLPPILQRKWRRIRRQQRQNSKERSNSSNGFVAAAAGGGGGGGGGSCSQPPAAEVAGLPIVESSNTTQLRDTEQPEIIVSS